MWICRAARWFRLNSQEVHMSLSTPWRSQTQEQCDLHPGTKDQIFVLGEMLRGFDSPVYKRLVRSGENLEPCCMKNHAAWSGSVSSSLMAIRFLRNRSRSCVRVVGTNCAQLELDSVSPSLWSGLFMGRISDSEERVWFGNLLSPFCRPRYSMGFFKPQT